MAFSLSLRWFAVSIVVLIGGVYLGLRDAPIFSNSLFSATSGTASQTYCYESIDTLQDPAYNDPSPRSSATCFTVTDGIFTSVFNSTSPPTPILPGHVIPGLWDGHGHLLQYGEFLHSVDLFGSTSFADVRSRIKAYIATNSDAPGGSTLGDKQHWIRGVGWDQMALGSMPTAELLVDDDEELEGLYVMLDRVDVHCSWVSPAVLALLPDRLDDIPGGEIVRTPGMGVFCDNSMDLVTDLWPKPTDGQKAEFVKTAMGKLNEVGLVGIHDAGVVPRDLKLYESLVRERRDEWTVRVYAMLECEKRNEFCGEEAKEVWRPGGEDADGWLTVRSVKLFADGALGSWGSAMLDPYTDKPTTSGSLLVDAATLTNITALWATAGFQVNIHAIGDLANRLAINAMEAAVDSPSALAARRFRIEHAQILHPSDQARILNLGILPSVQPTHATSDMKYAALRLGLERTRDEAYRLRSLRHLDAGGANPILGSDFPVEPPDPFQGIYAAVARRNPATGEGQPDGGGPWLEGEALTVQEALRGFTRDVAYGGFMEEKAGVIREGAWADWVVLDKPLGEYKVEELRRMRVRETWVSGRKVYKRG